jgi:protein subunit release factor B
MIRVSCGGDEMWDWLACMWRWMTKWSVKEDIVVDIL